MNLLGTSTSIALFLLLTSSKSTARVLELDERFVTVNSQGLWLVMFYAPWCGHCKQMEPTWLEVGAELLKKNSDVSVARLDATKYSSLASKFGIRGFPTIKFFKYGQQLEYNGARKTHSIVSFVEKASGPEISALSHRQEFEEARSEHDVFFVYVGSVDENLYALYSKAARALFTKISFYSVLLLTILPKELTVNSLPTIVVFKDNKHYVIPSNSPNLEFLIRWIRQEQFPSYNHFTGNSYHSLREAGRKFAIAVVSQGDNFKRTVGDIALKRKFPYMFTWTDDGAFVNKLTYSDVSLPNLVVFDASSNEYYVMREKDARIAMTRRTVEKFLNDIQDGAISPQGGSGFLQQVKRLFFDVINFIVTMFSDHPLVSSLVVIVPTVLISALCVCLCSMTDEGEEDVGTDSEFDDEDELLDASAKGGVESGYVPVDDGEEVETPALGVGDPEGEGLRQRVKDKEEE